MRCILIVNVLALLTLMPAQLLAQAVTDPTQAEFIPSADHQATTTDGTPIVSGYDLEFYMLGAAAPFQTQALGKPAPESDGLIHVPLTSTAMPTGVVFEARVRAVGPGGAGTSAPSNTFMYSVSCTYALAPASHTFGSTGGSGSASVTTGAGCDWVATASPSWIVVATSTTAGSGSGSVDFSVMPNTTASTRAGTLTVAGRTVSISQAGTTPCSFTVSTNPTSFAASGGTGSSTVVVSSGSGCGWTATSGSNWITLGAGASGSGNGSVAFTVAANTSTSQRNGSLTVAGQMVPITQSPATSCSYTLAPTSQSFTSSGGTGTGSVTTTSTCGWTASSGAGWLTVTAGASGTGNGTVNYSVAAYTGTTTRTGTLSVAGRTLSVTQSGQTTTCTAALLPTQVTFAGGNGAEERVSVSIAAGCAWTARSGVSWVTVASGASGTGSGVVTLRASRNSSSQPRSGTVVIAGLTLNVTQVASSSGGGPRKPRRFRRTG